MKTAPPSRRRPWAAGAGAAFLIFCGSAGAPAARQACSPQVVTRLGGTTPSANSRGPSISGDGRFVAFHSSAADLDGDIDSDVFIYDRTLCTLELISRSFTGGNGNNQSELPSISGDGRFVAFESSATNLVSTDTNGTTDVFVRDRLLGITILASLDSDEGQPTSSSNEAVISGDGRFVAFVSNATTLVSGDTNGEADLFVRDLINGTTERVSISTAGTQGDSTACCGVSDAVLSDDGSVVAFRSSMNNLVLDDFNDRQDVFVRDRQAGTTLRASVTSAGGELVTTSSSPAMTADGRWVFFKASDNFVPGDGTCDGVFVRDLLLSTTSCPALDPMNQSSQQTTGDPAVSADGRYVAFTSCIGHHAPGVQVFPGGDVCVHDRLTGATRRASTTQYGAPAGGGGRIVISGDGLFVAFESGAANLVPGDTNNATDVFATAWGGISSAPDFDLLRNGSFTTGLPFWQTFATPDQSYIVTDTTGALLQFYRVPPPPGTTNQAVVFQQTWAQLLPHAPLEARFRVGNSSTARKRLSVLVHEGDFSDLSVCTFWLEAGAPLRDYVMRSHTTKFWSNATISFYAASAGSDGGFYQLDAVSLAYRPLQDDDRTDCVDPAAPVAPGGVPGPALLANGDFSAGLAPWTTFGQITWQIAGGIFEFLRPPGTPAGVVLQQTGQALAQHDILTAAFYLGNSSSVRKRVTVLLHDGDFGDLSACTFWLAPEQLPAPYSMRAFMTKAWSNATISFYPATVGPDAWIQLDDVTLQLTPGSTPLGTECIEPGADTAALAARGLSAANPRARAPQPNAPAGRPAVLTPRVGGHGTPALWQTTLDLRDTAEAQLHLLARFAARDATATLEVSLDGMTWTKLAVVPASNEGVNLELDLSPFAGAIVHLRLVTGADR